MPKRKRPDDDDVMPEGYAPPPTGPRANHPSKPRPWDEVTAVAPGSNQSSEQSLREAAVLLALRGTPAIVQSLYERALGLDGNLEPPDVMNARTSAAKAFLSVGMRKSDVEAVVDEAGQTMREVAELLRAEKAKPTEPPEDV